MSFQTSMLHEFLEFASYKGYEVEQEGHLHIAHVNGVDMGIWDSKYGGCGFGWFY
jgi:hypothetical protein